MDSTVKISKKDFVDTLYIWLSEHLTEKEVKSMADEFGSSIKGLFKIKTKRKLYSKLYIELYTLNMYLIVFACEEVIKNSNKKKDVIELFHKTVYRRNIKVSGMSYRKWYSLMELTYSEYQNIMESESLLSPLLLLSNAFCKNIFGEDTKKIDSSVKFEIGMRIGGIAKQLSNLLREYEVE